MSDALAALPPLREVIARHGLAARKALGQNFLLDLQLTARIARTAGPLEGCDVLEIGPGPGGLTRGLLAEGARRVHVIEKDERCLPALEEIAAAAPGRLVIHHGDALALMERIDIARPFKVVANLPYNVGTELFTRWVAARDWPPGWASLTLMFQREVAERITASPGARAYGRLAVLTAWRCAARIALTLPPQAFTPPPKVHSAVVHVTPLPAPRAPAELDALSRVTAAAFGQRRKMLRASLKGLLGGDAAARLEAIGIDPTRRAETLSLEEFCAIARMLEGDG